MRLVETLVVRDDDADVLDAHLSFHLAAGVDLVLSAVVEPAGEAAAALEPHLASGRVRAVAQDPGASEDETRARLARLAAEEHGADWVLDGEPEELWWPRGETLQDALAPIPRRYGLVQGLVRLFPPQPGQGPFAERLTLRRSLEPPARPEPLEWALRPLHRAEARLALAREGGDAARGLVPLRAWYPFEVLAFPLRGPAQAERRLASGRPPRSTLEAAALEGLRAGRLSERLEELAVAGPLVEDTRLRDALRSLAAADAPPLAFRAPDVVDDAAYAVECAAVGEVDLPRLEAAIAELEGRIAWLEARLWPRVLRRASRLARRGR